MKTRQVTITNEALIEIWVNHVKLISPRLDTQCVWAYYKEQLAQAERLHLKETLYEICCYYLELAVRGKPTR
jgi:hypothetical protein